MSMWVAFLVYLQLRLTTLSDPDFTQNTIIIKIKTNSSVCRYRPNVIHIITHQTLVDTREQQCITKERFVQLIHIQSQALCRHS